MGGFVRGKVDCLLSNKDVNFNIQNVFKNLYDFFTSHPQYTLIAMNYGATNGPAAAGAGTGTGYCDAASSANGTPGSFGNNAFFVVRQNATTIRQFDVYHYFQWTGATNWTRGQTITGYAAALPVAMHGNTTYSSVGGSNSAGSVIYQCAIGVSGSGGTSSSLGGNPWKGTTNANGADTKGSPHVWGAPGGGGDGVMIFPRSNDGDTGAWRASSTVGKHAENCGVIMTSQWNNANIYDIRMHIIADDDSWVFWCDTNDQLNGSYMMSYSGIYTPRNDMPSGSLPQVIPYMCINHGVNALPWSNNNESIYGDIAGTSAQQGGVVGMTTASVRPLVMDHLGNFTQAIDYQPNYNLSSSLGPGAFFDEFQIPVGIFEASPQQISGYLGTLDFIRESYNVPTNTVRWDYNRLWVGTSTVNSIKYSIPWDSQNKTTPRMNNTREGITFVRPGPA